MCLTASSKICTCTLVFSPQAMMNKWVQLKSLRTVNALALKQDTFKPRCFHFLLEMLPEKGGLGVNTVVWENNPEMKPKQVKE